MGVRRLVVVLGDQLDAASSAFDAFEPAQDLVWMCEAREESTHVWSSKPRIAFFLAAMRHFAAGLEADGIRMQYLRLDDLHNRGTLAAELARALADLRPESVVVTEPGEWRVRKALRDVCARAGVALEIRADRHFLCSTEDFARHARGR